MPVLHPKSEEEFNAILSSLAESKSKDTVFLKRFVLVDFSAEWCGPCKRVAPLFETLSDTYDKYFTFIKVDVDQCSSVAQRYDVAAMPTFMFFIVEDYDNPTDNVLGADINKVKAVIERLIATVTVDPPNTDPLSDDPRDDPSDDPSTDTDTRTNNLDIDAVISDTSSEDNSLETFSSNHENMSLD